MINPSLLPVGDDDRGVHRTPFIVWTLLLINVAVFIYQISLSDNELTRFLYAYGAVPFELTNFEDIPPTIDYPVQVTILTSMFMHGGLLHIGANMLYLWIFGDNVEDALGHFAFLIFYLVCGLAAVFAQVAISADSATPIVGASGAIAGIMGAYLVMFPGGAVRVATFLGFIPILFRLPAIIVIGFWFLLQAFSGFASLGVENVEGGTAFFAHIGGFLAGMLLSWLLGGRGRSARRY